MTILVTQDREGNRIGIGEDLGQALLDRAQPVAQRVRPGGNHRLEQPSLGHRLQGIQQIRPVLAPQARRFRAGQQGADHGHGGLARQRVRS